ncbi:MAG: endonuclease/exonuclease/phosphatase family protein [Phycisphaerales bacterium]|nr:endonuclease/exonuclease/phosphatase family protein [Phycisphaerales bacterium]
MQTSLSNRRLAAALLTSAAAFLASCASDPGTPQRRPGPVVTANVPVTLDGNIEEWPSEAALLADDRYIYFRVSVEDSQWTLQSAPETLAMLIDVDGSTATGHHGEFPADALGVDVEIQFSPIGPDGHRQNGVAVFALDSQGNRTPISNEIAQVAFLPTYASTWYEGRISRHLTLPVGGAHTPTTAGPMSGMAVLLGDEGQIEGWSDASSLMAPAAATPTAIAAVTGPDLPTRPIGALRLMTWNVLKNGPAQNPEPYARVIETLNPDVILFQEWDEGDETAIDGWFTAVIRTPAPWKAVKGHAGVLIVSRHPITPIDLGRLETLSAEGRPSQIRYIAATVNSPIGDVAVASTHLKCCGSKDSPEDRQRMDQARAINRAMMAASPTPPALRFIAGDMNLVGSRPPLDLLRAGLDADGSDLSVADPFVLGDRSQYTWADYKTTFTPGRLDYVLYSDSTAQVYQSFVLDTQRLAEETLARAGLNRTDTDVSDHKPIVFDVMPIAR